MVTLIALVESDKEIPYPIFFSGLLRMFSVESSLNLLKMGSLILSKAPWNSEFPITLFILMIFWFISRGKS